MCQRLIRFFTLAALLCLGGLTATAASSFIVNTTNDSGAGSLRQAIVDANANAGADNIYFLIISGTGVRTIVPASPLPAITDPVTISGYTQPGSSVNTLAEGNNAVLRIELNGSSAGGDVLGLYLATSNCTVRGLVINSFSGASLVLAGTGGHLVEGNFIGTDAAGALSRTNSAGVYVTESAQNIIGGTTPAARNLISGNTGAGINVEGVGASNNVISGNFIGSDVTGTNRLGNGMMGVGIFNASGNSVGGTNAASRNIVSGNGGSGILVSGSWASNNVIRGNFIGTDRFGLSSLSNLDGISIDYAPGNFIGGSKAGEGNVISGNQENGIELIAADRNQIQGNYVGLGADGDTPVPNQQYGIYLVNASLNGIGGTEAGARNLLSANYSGCVVAGGASNIIQGNYVGTDASGLALRNNHVGIYLAGSAANWIGGDVTGAGNLISGNEANVQIYSTTSSNNVVAGNLIGTDRTGLAGLGGGTAVEIADAPRNRIGGSTTAARNVISGNREGVIIYESGAVGNVVSGNLIGVGVNGATPVGNLSYGVLVAASGNRIGGLLTGEGNVIAHNGAGWPIWRAGVVIAEETSVGNSILGNSIFANDSVGIDLGGTYSVDSDGVTLNDLGDTDTGPNNRQNFPVLVSATSAGGTIVYGTLKSAANAIYRLEFFASPSADPSGYGEGVNFLGATNVTTDNGGRANFAAFLPAAGAGSQVVSATATDANGNTSEFSLAVPVGVPGDADPGFNPNANNSIYSTALQPDGKIVIGGNFTAVGGTARSAMARLNADGTLDSGFNPNVNNLVVSTVLQADGKIVIGGGFSAVGGVSRGLIARLNADGTLDPEFNLFVSGGATPSVQCMAMQADGKIVIGGVFTTVAFTARNRLARFNADGSLDDSFNPDANERVYSLAVQPDGKIVIGGGFTAVGGTVRNRLARLNADGTLDAGFNPNANNIVYNTAVQADGKIVIAGNFNSVRGTSRNFLARLNTDGTVDTGFNPNPDSGIFSTAVQADGRIVIGGVFTSVGGTARNRVARLQADGTLDTGFDSDVDDSVFGTVVQADGQIIIAGFFTSVDGTARNRIARLLNGAATQTLAVTSAARVKWVRGGSAPETTQVTFELSTNGMTWTTLGSGTRLAGIGWELTGLSLPTNGTIRARARVTGGYLHGSSGLVEQQATFSLAPEICVPPPSGLVAWWRAENNALDAVGTNHGTLRNGAGFAAGEVGRGFQLHGYDNVEVADSPELYPGTNSFTVDAWIKTTDASSGDHYIVSRYELGGADTPTNGFLSFYGLYVENGRFAGVLRDAGNGTDFSTQKLSSSSPVADGDWHHVALVRDMAAGRILIYQDGVLEASTVLTGVANGAIFNEDGKADPFVIGANRLGNSDQFVSFFTGGIDEVGYVARALTSNEFAAIFAAGSAGKCLSTNCVAPPSGLAAWWRAEDNALDAIGTNHGALANGTVFVGGQAGRAFSFDGVNDYVSVPDSPVWDFGTNDFTIEFWVKLAAIQNTMFLHQQSGAGVGGFEFHFNSGGGLVFGLSTVEPADSGNWIPQTNVWYHLAVTRLNQFFRIYADGVQIPNSGHFNPNPIANVTGVVRLGSFAAGGYELAGAMDEVSVYHSGLPSAEIAALHLAGSAGKCLPVPVNIGVQGRGGVVRSPNRPVYFVNDQITLTATNARYYRFANWSDGGTNQVRTITISNEISLTAHFTPVTPLERRIAKAWEVDLGGVGDDSAAVVRTTADGGFLVGGTSSSGVSGNKTNAGFGGQDFWVVKLDGQGLKQWEHSYGGTNDDVLSALERTPDGGFLLGGWSASPSSGNKFAPNRGSNDFWIIKVDANGSALWDRTFGGTDSDQLKSLKPTSDGGFILAGQSYSETSGNKTSISYGGADYWVIKLDGDGTKVWETTLGNDSDDFCVAVVETASGQFGIFGDITSIYGGTIDNEPSGGRDPYLEVLDANGAQVWESVPSQNSFRMDDFSTALLEFNANSFFAAGSATGLGTNASGPYGGLDFVLMWLEQGNGQSSRAEWLYGGTGEDRLTSLIRTVDGGFVMGGYSDSPVSGSKTSPNYGASDFWLIKNLSNGDFLEVPEWQRSFGGTAEDRLFSVQQIGEGFILAGDSASGIGGTKLTPNYGQRDMWVIRLTHNEVPFGTPTVLVNDLFTSDGVRIVTNAASVGIQSTFAGGSIRYTLDGSPPAGGVLYTGAFVLTQPALVRAIAYAADFSSSSEADAVLVDVVAPPFIITQPSGRTVGSGAQVPLSVVAGGTAQLSYQWRRNGVAVPGATEASLLLTGIQSSQGGDYSVVITNDYGAITSAVATVVVFAPPSFLNQPVSVTVTVGGTATFSVSALGPPPLEFQWRKNGANIAGATNSTLTIANVQFDDGASYSVVVASPGGTLVSDPALLIVTVPSPPAGDNFASTNTLLGASGSATGTNNFATREPGEPLHAGKPGSNSVWYSWTAPVKGIATFRTTGSTFDTLLGIYTGTNVANLRTIVSDEDGGGFLTSRASFNASNGVTYHIAIDGLNGQQGGCVLRWELIATDESVPVIVCPPARLTVLPGQNATFTVSATGSSLAYQWLLNGTNIAGATNAVYTRTNTEPEHVGFCSVRVTSVSGQTVESAPALLEIGLDPGVQSRDKPDDVDATCPGLFAPAAGAGSVAMGSVGYQVLVSSSTNNLIDCNTTNCGGIPTGTRYLELQPSASGTFLIDTVGSASRTKLWVCRAGTNNLDRTRTYLTCDVDSTPDGRSIVSFNAESGSTYQVWISKLDNTNGVLQLNWKLGLPPRIASLSSSRFVMEGTTTTLSVSATNVIGAGVPATNALSAPIYTWYFNGPTSVATGPMLNLNNLKAGDAGQYLVVARNEVGMTSAVVRVEVFGPAGVAVVQSGGATELYADATTAGCGAAPARYQWRLNDALLAGQTNRSLILQGTQPTQAGQYSVTVSNCFGTTTYLAATVAVTVDVGFTAEIVGGQVVLQWQTTPGKHYRVEYCTTPDGGNWLPLQPDLTAATSSLMVMDALGSMPRFYRIVLLD